MSLETSQLAPTDANVVLIADPADIPQRHAVPALNLKGPGTGKSFAAVDLGRRVHDEFSHRILVHFRPQFLLIAQATRL
jgi:hypothetical protein